MSARENSSIKVVNDFVDVKPLSKSLGSGAAWMYGTYPGLLGDAHPSWHVHLCGSKNPHDRAVHDDVLDATPELAPLNDVWKLIKTDLAPEYGLVRAYASGHTYGQEGTTHRYSKPSDDEFVALIYVSEEWKDGWAGETVFYDPARECVSIRPRPGRLLFFDGSIARASRPPSRECPTLCTTLSFHMRRTAR